tara:strand:- start:1536 stop:1760 length:225 start_codon:yes stop_codon:yes gene_type:complete
MKANLNYFIFFIFISSFYNVLAEEMIFGEETIVSKRLSEKLGVSSASSFMTEPYCVNEMLYQTELITPTKIFNN